MNHTSANTKPITTTAIAAIESVFREFLSRVEADFARDIGDWMRAQGFDPDKRCFLVLPVTMRKDLPSWPPFVRFSPYIDSPILMRDNLGVM